jgi:hypothetical protein
MHETGFLGFQHDVSGRGEAGAHPGGKAMSEVVVCNNSCSVVFVLGVTRTGRLFRPSDWVDRLAGRCSTFGQDKLLKYSPSVRPLTVEGMRGLLVDIRLVESDPAAFRFVMDFAADNDLAIQCLETAARGNAATADPSAPAHHDGKLVHAAGVRDQEMIGF